MPIARKLRTVTTNIFQQGSNFLSFCPISGKIIMDDDDDDDDDDEP